MTTHPAAFPLAYITQQLTVDGIFPRDHQSVNVEIWESEEIEF